MEMYSRQLVSDLEFRGVENGDMVLVEIDLLQEKGIFEAVAQGEQCYKLRMKCRQLECWRDG